MPIGPPHACATPGCSAQVPRGRGRCDDCARKANQARGTFHQRGYDAQWRSLRLRHLQAHPLCARCQADGRITAATVVDHRRPWQSGADDQERQRLKYDSNNLESMCAPHHSRKTVLEDGGFGRAKVAR